MNDKEIIERASNRVGTLMSVYHEKTVEYVELGEDEHAEITEEIEDQLKYVKKILVDELEDVGIPSR